MNHTLRAPLGLGIAALGALVFPFTLANAVRPVQMEMLLGSGVGLALAAVGALRLARGAGPGLLAFGLFLAAGLRTIDLAIQVSAGIGPPTLGSVLLSLALLQGGWYSLAMGLEARPGLAGAMRITVGVAALSRIYIAALFAAAPAVALTSALTAAGFLVAATGSAWEPSTVSAHRVPGANPEGAA